MKNGVLQWHQDFYLQKMEPVYCQRKVTTNEYITIWTFLTKIFIKFSKKFEYVLHPVYFGMHTVISRERAILSKMSPLISAKQWIRIYARCRAFYLWPQHKNSFRFGVAVLIVNLKLEMYKCQTQNWIYSFCWIIFYYYCFHAIDV